MMPDSSPREGGEVVREALAAAARRLAQLTHTGRLDAELLMAHALGTSREDMLLNRQGDPAPQGLEPLVARREAGEPVAYITGRRAFWTIELEVGPGALVPRPDTETLIEAAVDHFGERAPRRILDLGTGPGTLLLAALAQWPEASGIGVDASADALAYARRNAERLGFAGRAELRLGDWTDGLTERFDLILSNPPYVEVGAPLSREVEREPAEALFAGPDGLDSYRRLAPLLRPLLAEGGIACVEIGYDQAARASALFEAEGFTISSRMDLSNVPRCLLLEP